MKKIICLLAVVFLLFVSCDDGGSDSDGGSSKTVNNDTEQTSNNNSQPVNKGTTPQIKAVTLYGFDAYTGERIYTDVFEIDDIMNCDITITDPDLNIDRVEVMSYSPADSNTPYDGPTIITLDSQSEETMDYSIIGNLVIVGPAGSYRYEFQAFDSKGNSSNIFKKNMEIIP